MVFGYVDLFGLFVGLFVLTALFGWFMFFVVIGEPKTIEVSIGRWALLMICAVVLPSFAVIGKISNAYGSYQAAIDTNGTTVFDTGNYWYQTNPLGADSLDNVKWVTYQSVDFDPDFLMYCMTLQNGSIQRKLCFNLKGLHQERTSKTIDFDRALNVPIGSMGYVKSYNALNWVHRLVYEVMERDREAFLTFYNPYDEAQQLQFDSFVRSKLEPALTPYDIVLKNPIRFTVR